MNDFVLLCYRVKLVVVAVVVTVVVIIKHEKETYIERRMDIHYVHNRKEKEKRKKEGETWCEMCAYVCARARAARTLFLL
jgi:heme exporter protein D